MGNLKRIASTVIVLILVLSCAVSSLTASATDYNNISYTDYNYWIGGTTKNAVPTKALFEPVKAVELSSFGYDTSVLTVEDTCYDGNGNLLVLDSADGKIIVLDRNYNKTGEITEVEYKGKKIGFKGAKSISWDNGILYICDTENGRVLCCRDNKVERTVECPESNVIPEDFVFAPIGVACNGNGFTFVLSDGCYYGLLAFTPKYEFVGFFGANNVTNSLFEAVGNWITELFETQEKHDASAKKLPYLLTDICVTSNGYLCGVNAESKGQIRMFSATGENILRYSEQYETGNGDSFNFADEPNNYVDTNATWSGVIAQSFSSVTSDSEGYIYALDSTQGRIYMYDKSCNLLGVFGGGLDNTQQLGRFASPVSVCSYGNELSVLDFVNKNITVFRCTDFGSAVKQAQALTSNGEYAEAYPLWKEVYAQDKNYQPAYNGISRYYLEQKEYSRAMEFSKAGNDQVTYAQAFRQYRNAVIKDNLAWIFVGIFLIAAAVFAVVLYMKKKKRSFKLNPRIRDCGTVLFHPIECFGAIKSRQSGSVVIATVLLVLFYVGTVCQKLLGGFMYENTDLTEFNSIYTMIGSIGLMLLYVVINWAACVLFEGKGKFKEIYCASCYCLVPLIINSIAYIVLSYIIVPSSNSGMSLMTTVFQAIFIIYLLLSITVIHDFSFFKAVGMAIVIVLGMIVAVFVLFAVLTLSQDLISFVIGLFKEILLR